MKNLTYDDVTASGGPRQKSLILGVGTAVPASSYSQADILEAFDVQDRRIRSVFVNGGIDRRNLCLPSVEDGSLRTETQAELISKHVTVGLDIGTRALASCLKQAGAELDDVRYICCVSSTGFIVPGFSALLIKELGLSTNCSRLDVVGMGCNAGLNGLGATAGWSELHPGELAVMICIEVCSALYVFDDEMSSAVVNSLFGDGAAAVALISGRGGSSLNAPSLMNFASHIIPEASDAMRIDWHEGHGKFSFALEQDVPYVVGAHAINPITRLLEAAHLLPSDIDHWIIHSGGRKVIDSVRVNLGLTRSDVRHTLGVLRDHGNLSSGSFLFSYERLNLEGSVSPGDTGVMMTMGPGSTIETALLQW